MARMNEILTGRHNRLLQKLFSMKGEPPSPQLSSEIMPVLPLMHGVENRYLEGWERFAGSVEIAGVAGQDSMVQFRNPPVSNVFAVLERLSVESQTSQRIHVTENFIAGQADLTNIFNANRLEFRIRPQSSVILSGFTQVPGADLAFLIYGGIVLVNVPRDVILDTDHQIPISPGQTIRVTGQAVNTDLTVNFVWRERFFEDSERT